MTQYLQVLPEYCPEAFRNTFRQCHWASLQVVLLRPADWDGCNLFRGGRIYGGSYNELEAYLYFCRYGWKPGQSATCCDVLLP